MTQRIDPSSQTGSTGRKIPQARKQTPKISDKPAAKKTPGKQTATSSSTPAASSVVANVATRLSLDERRRLIAEAAYLRAEQRGFANGNEVDDWLAAEAEINAKYPQ